MTAAVSDIWATLALSTSLTVVILAARRSNRDFILGGVLAFLAGVMAIFPALWLEALLQTPYPVDLLHAPALVRLIDAFVLSALVEEFFKFLFLWTLFRRSQIFQTKSNAVLLGVLAGAGFAGLESLFRTLPSLSSLPAIIPNIAVWIIPYGMHLVAGAGMGFFFYVAYREVLPSGETSSLMQAVVIPTLFHGIYNFISSSPSESAWIWSSLYVFGGAFAAIFALSEARPSAVSAEDTEAETDVLDADDPIQAIIDLRASPRVKIALTQELLSRNGISGYSIVSLLRASDGVITLKSIWLKDFQVCAIKLFSPKEVNPGGVSRFRNLLERLRENSPDMILKYREFREFPRFLVIIRDYGFATLSEYMSGLLTREERIDLALQILGIVKEMWQRGLYHGRLTPQNLVFRQGQMVVADPGQALLTSDKERHRIFVEAARPGEEPWSFARDYRSVRALLSWLAGDETILPMDIELEEVGGEVSQEPVERAELALERYQVQSTSLARLLVERARRSLREQEGSGYTELAIIALMRAHALAPNPELNRWLEHLSERALAKANKALLDWSPEEALQSLARYMELRPDSAEIAGVRLEKITTSLLKKGDYLLFRKRRPGLALRFYRAALALNPGAAEPRGRIELIQKTPLLPASAIYQFVLLSAIVVMITLLIAQRVALQRPHITLSRATAEGWRSTAKLGDEPVLQKVWERSFREKLSPFVFEDKNSVVIFGEKSAIVLSKDTGEPTGELILSDQYEETATVTAHPIQCNQKLMVPLKKVRGTENRFVLAVYDSMSSRTGIEFPSSGIIFGLGCQENRALDISSGGVRWTDLIEMKPALNWIPESGEITADGVIYGNLLLVPVSVLSREGMSEPASEGLAEEEEPGPETPKSEETAESGEQPAAATSPRTPPGSPLSPPSPPVEPSEPPPKHEANIAAILLRRSSQSDSPDAASRRLSPSVEPTQYEDSSRVVALSVHSGKPIFTMAITRRSDHGLVLSQNYLLVSGKHYLAAYDLNWREVRWQNDRISLVQAPVVADANVLAVGERRATVLDLKTGAPRFETGVINPVAEAVYAAPYFVIPSARAHPIFPSARSHSLTLISARNPIGEALLNISEGLPEATIGAVEIGQSYVFVIQRRGEGSHLVAYRNLSAIPGNGKN